MADTYPLTNARARLGELVNRARFGRDRVILTEHGRPVAAIISVEDLAELQAAVDAADLATAKQIMASDQPLFAHDDVMAAMDALDACDGAESAEAVRAILAPHRTLLEGAGYSIADRFEP